MVEFASWLTSLPIGQALRRLNWLVPWLQIIHILANGVVLGAVVMIGMRAWGISHSLATTAMARRFLPWIWGALVVLTVTGIMLLVFTPRRALGDLAFQVKMWTMGAALVATVGLLVVLAPSRAVKQDETGRHALASLVATLALVLWVGVTLAGRGRWFALMMTRMMQ